MGKYVFAVDIYKGAVMKIAAVKLLIRKVYVLKNESACAKPYNFFVGFYVVVNILFDFSGIRNMVETVVFFFCKVAVCVKG